MGLVAAIHRRHDHAIRELRTWRPHTTEQAGRREGLSIKISSPAPILDPLSDDSSYQLHAELDVTGGIPNSMMCALARDAHRG